jgi:cyclopropane fatty-acyl-phospholipid synthase-like methyltransferase
MENQVKIFFDEVQNYLHRDFGVILRRELIHEAIGEVANTRIIDIGCGNGDISIPYIEKNNITFLDFSTNMLELVKNKIKPEFNQNVTILNKDFFEIDENSKYDTILFIGVLAHSPKSILDNLNFLNKILDDKGQLFLQFSDSDHWITRLEFKLRKTKYTINKTTKKDIENTLHSAGFQIEKRIRYACLLPGFGKLPNKLQYYYVSYATKLKFFKFMCSEYIFKLKKV